MNRTTGRAYVIDANKNAGPWKGTIAAAALAQRPEWVSGPLTGALCVSLTFVRLRPAGHFGTGRNAGRLKDSAPAHPTTRPDVDKLSRAVLDGLTGVAYRDDAQVVLKVARKRYAEPGEVEHVEIEIAEL